MLLDQHLLPIHLLPPNMTLVRNATQKNLTQLARLLHQRSCGAQAAQRSFSAGAPHATPSSANIGLHITRKLSDIVKLPLLQREEASRVRDIWLEQKKPRVVNGTVLADEYTMIKENGRACPAFLIPVYPDASEGNPNSDKPGVDPTNLSGVAAGGGGGDAFYNLIMQWRGSEVVYAFLDDYKRDPINCLPYMTCVFFEELRHSHNLVLLRGDIISKNLSMAQASKIIRTTRELYRDPAKFEFVKKFNQRPDEFDFNEYARAARGW